MKTTKILLCSSALLCVVFLTACRRIFPIEGNGRITVVNRSISSFSRVESQGAFHVFISYDTIQSVKIEAEENLIPYIETDRSGATLIVKTKNHRHIKNHYPIKIYVKTPVIEGIELSGSGEIACDSMNTSSLDLHLSGSGDISVITSGDKVHAHISGSGEIYLSGSANETDFDINGSGDIRSYNLQQNTCFANISGSGDMYVYVNKLLDVKISGSGKVHYMGNPAVNSSISGSGIVVHE